MIEELLAELDQIEAEAGPRLAACTTSDEVDAVRVAYLGRKGSLTRIMKSIGKAAAEDRPKLGARAGAVRKLVTEGLQSATEAIEAKERAEKFAFDITLPGRTPSLGRPHPLAIVMDRVVSIFKEMGFSVAEGPEIEHDYYNFEALNFPPDHPARDMQDTYFLKSPGWLLRTHTSPVQIREMEKRKPPLRMLMPGRVYRNEDVNVRSMNQFYQVEGLYVDKGVTFADLKGDHRRLLQALLQPRDEGAFPALVLPVHRAERRGGRYVHHVQGRRVPDLQEHGLAGDSGLRHGRPEPVQVRRLRPRGGDRLRLRHGNRPHGHDALRRG